MNAEEKDISHFAADIIIKCVRTIIVYCLLLFGIKKKNTANLTFCHKKTTIQMYIYMKSRCVLTLFRDQII